MEQKRLCDMVDISCTDCPFGFLDADAGCPLYWDKDEANADITQLSMNCGTALTKLLGGE